jgi:hypothetical protein
MSHDNTSAIKTIHWSAAPTSDSGLRAFARRHGFSPKRTTSGKWVVEWSSFGDAEEYGSAIAAIRAEVNYRRG